LQIGKAIPNGILRNPWRMRVLDVYHYMGIGLSGNMEAAEHSHAVLV
jgi:hypothetical protein